MGLIKAALGSVGGVMADQWKEYFYCEAMPANILATKGHKKVTGRSSNYKGDENITQFWYEADDAANEIYHYYLCGIPMSAEKTMRASATARKLISSDASTETPIPGEVRGAYDDGRAYCGYALLQQDAETDGGMWHRYLFLYTDAGENACVLMQVDSRAKTEAGLASEEALLAFAREAWKNVEILK